MHCFWDRPRPSKHTGIIDYVNRDTAQWGSTSDRLCKQSISPMWVTRLWTVCCFIPSSFLCFYMCIARFLLGRIRNADQTQAVAIWIQRNIYINPHLRLPGWCWVHIGNPPYRSSCFPWSWARVPWLAQPVRARQRCIGYCTVFFTSPCCLWFYPYRA